MYSLRDSRNLGGSLEGSLDPCGLERNTEMVRESVGRSLKEVYAEQVRALTLERDSLRERVNELTGSCSQQQLAIGDLVIVKPRESVSNFSWAIRHRDRCGVVESLRSTELGMRVDVRLQGNLPGCSCSFLAGHIARRNAG